MLVDKKKWKVFERCKSNPLGVATLAGGDKHSQKRVEERSQRQQNSKVLETKSIQHENKISRKN